MAYEMDFAALRHLHTRNPALTFPRSLPTLPPCRCRPGRSRDIPAGPCRAQRTGRAPRSRGQFQLACDSMGLVAVHWRWAERNGRKFMGSVGCQSSSELPA